MSLLVYRMTVLPVLGDEFINKINKIWSNFLWDGKKPKIAWKILTAPKKNGGLGLSDLNKRDISIKAQWVLIYLRDETVRSLADFILNNKIGELLWKANFKEEDCHLITDNHGFWYNVLKSWAKFNYINPFGKNQIIDQLLWNNSFIKINDKLVCNLNMIQHGILSVRNLLTDQGFMTVKQFIERYPQVNIMDYLSLVHAIPNEWKKWIRDNFLYREDISPKCDLAEVMPSIVSTVYRSLHTNVYLLENKWQKWEIWLNIEIWPNDFLKWVNAIWSITYNSKLRTFQYRLLNHAIVTNVNLKLWKIVQFDSCTFCKNEAETIIHLFINAQN